MDPLEYLQIVALVGVLSILVPPLARYMARVYQGEPPGYTRPLRWLEHGIYRAIGVAPDHEMTWRQYTAALVAFNLVGLIGLFLLLTTQNVWSPGPEAPPSLPPWLAWNTAVSYVTNTDWQAYAGEVTMTHLVQMIGLTVQNFLSAGTGMAVAVALSRGLARRSTDLIGNYWTDLVRSVVYVLLPLSVILAVMLVSQGVIQNLASQVVIITLAGDPQTLPMGPVASQVAIKLLGTNGGGFFGAGSAHPFENPTPLSNFLETVAMLLIPVATPLMLGHLTGYQKHAKALLKTMVLLFAMHLVGALIFEWALNPTKVWTGAMEGKEVRLGVVASVLWVLSTTATSNGSVNAAMGSLTPLSGGLAMSQILLGEVVFGGVGTGLASLIMLALVTVFVAGLLVGRTPEYLQKKIEARDMVYATMGVMIPSALILMGAAVAAVTAAGLSGVTARGPHGLSEILYAFASTAGNNGSALGGLHSNTPFYLIMTSLTMLLGRFGVIIPVLALAGRLAAKREVPPSVGTLPAHGILFVGFLLGMILILGALVFFPVLCLGPLAEHWLMGAGRLF